MPRRRQRCITDLTTTRRKSCNEQPTNDRMEPL
jgi:hypothetical protein